MTAPPSELTAPPDPSRPMPRPAGRPAAAWLAIAGCGLLFVAAVVVVASRWQQIPPSLRLTGLLAALALIAVLAERIRRTAPTTAVVIAHLVPAISVTAGVAAGATAGRSWPTCIVIGGLLGAAVTEVEKRRWLSPRMAVIAAGAAVLVVSGLSAQVGAPAPVLAAVVACLLLAVRRELEAGVVAVLVGASPVLASVTTLKVGDGTMTRIGAAGSAVAWSAPLAGVLAAGVLAVLARRWQSVPIALSAVAALVIDVVAGLAVGAAPAATWCAIVPSLVIAIELAAMARTGGVWTSLASAASRAINRSVVVAVSVLAPIGFVAGIVEGSQSQPRWAITFALAAVAVALVGGRSASTAPRVADHACAAAVGFAVCVVVAVGGGWAARLAAAAIALVGFSVLDRNGHTSSPRLSSLATIRVAALYVFVAVVVRGLHGELFDHPDTAWTISAGVDVVVAITAGMLWCAALLRRRALRLDQVALAIAATGIVAACAAAQMRATVAAAAIAMVGLQCVRRRPQLAVPVAAMVATCAWIQAADHRPVSALAIVISAGFSLVPRWPAWLRHAGAAQLVAAAWFVVGTSGLPANADVATMLVLAVSLTGIAFLTPAYTLVDSAALTATALMLLSLTVPGVHPAFASLACLVASAQCFCYAIAQRRRPLALGSAASGSAAVISLWFTSGVNAEVLGRLAPYDVRGTDLVVGLVAVVMLLGGFGLRRSQQVSTWSAYGPGLVLAGGWTLAVQTGRGADWATMVGLSMGVVAVAIGGWRRLAAPLVIGTGLIASTIVVATGAQLASLPGWSWLVAGGVALLALAVFIERHTDRNGAQSAASDDELTTLLDPE